MPGVRTNEVPGTRAVLRHYRMSATKARQILDLIRGQEVDRAEEMLRTTPREAARVVGKVLASAVANARNNDLLDPEDLYVSACYADEGTTIKRWRPRARGRATRIRKRTCHITVIVSRLPEDRLEVRRARQATQATTERSRRVAASRRSDQTDAEADHTAVDGSPGTDDADAPDDVDALEDDDEHEAETDEAGEAGEAGGDIEEDDEDGDDVDATDEVENVDADAPEAEEGTDVSAEAEEKD